MRPAACVVLVLGALATAPASAQDTQAPVEDASETDTLPPLRLEEVLESVATRFPPQLAALIERDLREGRLRSARGVFDFGLAGKGGGTLDGFYEYTTVDMAAEQFLGLWGSTVYGGYRLTTGETLPDYYLQRTQGSGEALFGLNVPLLQGGLTDARRARIAISELDVEAAEPFIARQQIDFVRAATVAYFKWLAAGRKLNFSEELLALAEGRQTALEEQVANGLRPDIVLVDNQRLVVSRQLDVVSAQRDFQGSALVLSLFLRTADGVPTVPGRERLPQEFPATPPVDPDGPEPVLPQAIERRPELRVIELELEQILLERGVASNEVLPVLDANLEAARPFGEELYDDRSLTELRGVLEFKFPLQRRKAQGKVQELDSKYEQVRQKLVFAADKVVTEIRDAWIAVEAARQQIDGSELNVDLALQLQTAEQELFRLGSSDLLALQIREQAAFDARVTAVEAYLEYFSAEADYRAATAEGVEWRRPDPGLE